MYRNAEGYADPTAGAALAHIIREEKRKRKYSERFPGAHRRKGCQPKRPMNENCKNQFTTQTGSNDAVRAEMEEA